MRPLRLLLSLCSSLIAITLLFYVAFRPRNEELRNNSAATPESRFNALFSFTSPGSLFPPSAIISLTDDNSTFFLARPAAFGPALPLDGLSGALWIGSGFGDDILGSGELGCSDVPGWTDPDESDEILRTSNVKASASVPTPDGKTTPHTRSRGGDRSEHSDIKLLQEGAEIAGKVVLLKRGGCGFLEKVKWAQSRGGVALIVGDDVRGGALVRMYARGDTSGVDIPALFTSHTTAQLLSSLSYNGGLPQDLSANKSAKSKLAKTGKGAKANSNTEKSSKKQNGEPHSTVTKNASKSTQTLTVNADSIREQSSDSQHEGWFKSVAFALGFGSSQSRTAESNAKAGQTVPSSSEITEDNDEESDRWSGGLLGDRRDSPQEVDSTLLKGSGAPKSTDGHSKQDDILPDHVEPHQGLWVTLTPTTMSTSPFFDTLLVLVVSPLVTLTIVYALLLLRSRIRRRRWRAPKSLVERLPVRTYHTISNSSASPTPGASSPTTPLLQHSPSRSTSSLPRPRPGIEIEVPAASSSLQQPNRTPEEEKRESGLAAWRRRYGGRQKECVVCLEEYEDGVSRVMSLPCGHEFHADCITPWLVTRRRTCPICKGDVVRNLSQSYHDRAVSAIDSARFQDEDDEVQAQAAETRNDSPSASRPLPISSESFNADIEARWGGDDDEGGQDIPQRQGGDLSGSLRDASSSVATTIWRGFEAVGRATGLQRRPSREDVDRDR